MIKCLFVKLAPIVAMFSIAIAVAAQAQTFDVLANFKKSLGTEPAGYLAQGIDGDLYGTASEGSTEGDGAVFKTTVDGKLTTVSFDGTDGSLPAAGVMLATNGNSYGTAASGENGSGYIFEFTSGGTLTVLHSFDGKDGYEPTAPLIQGRDGDLYGTTLEGGAHTSNPEGTIFKVTPSGAFTTLYTFPHCSKTSCTEGSNPYSGLLQAGNGNFYGTTTSGGIFLDECGGGCGTIFEITPAGKLTTLYRFCSLSNCADGMNPDGGLVQGSNGNFYGTTKWGGANACYLVSIDYGCGTVFEITPQGELTTLYSFCSQANCTDGIYPSSTLVLATDGNFYGTTFAGGVADCIPGFGDWCGTVFKITPSGELTTLHIFDGTDGGWPTGLIQHTNGTFYGAAAIGGANTCKLGKYDQGCGTFFSLSTGLGPFVKVLPDFGKTGATIKILGSELTGTTSVTFNGTPATFAVKSSTLIEAEVPDGATTGTTEVTTPSGTLSSNVAFQVLP